jgi:hypothetical protein
MYSLKMAVANECITVTLPRVAVGGVLSLSNALLERMHEQLERNTDGALSGFELEELAALVDMAQFGQIFSMALQAQKMA